MIKNILIVVLGILSLPSLFILLISVLIKVDDLLVWIKQTKTKRTIIILDKILYMAHKKRNKLTNKSTNWTQCYSALDEYDRRG